MSYADHEGSVEDGRPIELYEFTAGAQFFFYTSSGKVQTILGQDYTPISGLQRNENKDGSTTRRHDFRVTLPYDNPVAQLFTGTQAGVVVKLVVKRFHENDLPTPQVVLVFDGKVKGTSNSEDATEKTLNCRTALGSTGRQIPLRNYSGMCPNILYGLDCGADDTDIAFRASSLSVDSQVGNTLTITSGLSGTYAPSWFVGGYVEDIAAADFRLILAQSGNVLTLIAPFRNTPSLVNVFAGCDHTPGVNGCLKFDRIQDGYDGFNFVRNNPFEDGIR